MCFSRFMDLSWAGGESVNVCEKRYAQDFVQPSLDRGLRGCVFLFFRLASPRSELILAEFLVFNKLHQQSETPASGQLTVPHRHRCNQMKE